MASFCHRRNRTSEGVEAVTFACETFPRAVIALVLFHLAGIGGQIFERIV